MDGAPPYIAVAGAGGADVALALLAAAEDVGADRRARGDRRRPKRVAGIGTWEVDGVRAAADAGEAVAIALALG